MVGMLSTYSFLLSDSWRPPSEAHCACAKVRTCTVQGVKCWSPTPGDAYPSDAPAWGQHLLVLFILLLLYHPPSKEFRSSDHYIKYPYLLDSQQPWEAGEMEIQGHPQLRENSNLGEFFKKPFGEDIWRTFWWRDPMVYSPNDASQDFPGEIGPVFAG